MASIKVNLFILFALAAVASCQLSGSASSNPQGGQDVVVVGKLGAGTPDLNVVGGVFAAGNTDKMAQGAPATIGAFAGLNANGHGLSIEKTITPGIQSTLKENARINLLDDKTHKVDTNLFHSRTHLDKPNFTFDKYGGSLDYSNIRGHGLSIGKTITPGIQSTLNENARINIFDDKTHKVDTNLFHSRTHLDKPNFTFDKYGGSLDYSHIRGHGASVGISDIPGIGANLDLTGRANIWSSPDRMTSLDLTGTHTRGLSGQFSGQNNWGAGIGLTHRW